MARTSSRRTARAKKRSTIRTVDMTGVESGGRSISDGWASLTIKKAEWVDSKSSDNEMIKLTLTAKRGKEKATVYDNLVNTEASLFKMKQVLEAIGQEVPDGAVEIDADELVGAELEGLIANEDYEGKDQPRVIDYRATGAAGEIDEGEEGEEDEEEAPPRKKKSKARDEEPEEDEEEEEEAPRRRKKKAKKSSRDDEEEETEEEPEEEEEDEEPPPKKKLKKRPKDEEEDEEEEEPEEDEEPEEEEEEAPRKKKTSPKIRAGAHVKFDDDRGRPTKGTVLDVDGDTISVKSVKGDEYEMDVSELELA